MGTLAVPTSGQHTRMAVPGAPAAVAFLFRAPHAPAPPGCGAVLRAISTSTCMEASGGQAFNWSIHPLDGSGDPDLSVTLWSTLWDRPGEGLQLCGSGVINLWSFVDIGLRLTPGDSYAFVQDWQAPSAEADPLAGWRW